MDDCDRARHLQSALNAASAAYRKPVPKIEPMGECHACGEELDTERLFCDSHCTEEYERMERQHGRV